MPMHPWAKSSLTFGSVAYTTQNMSRLVPWSAIFVINDVTADDRVIVDNGLMRARAGTKVTPQEQIRAEPAPTRPASSK